MSVSIIDQLRSFRIERFSVIDIVGSFIGMYLLAPYVGISRETALWLTIPLAVLVHELIGVRTPLNKLLFEQSGTSCIKLAIIAITVVGLVSLRRKDLA